MGKRRIHPHISSYSSDNKTVTIHFHPTEAGKKIHIVALRCSRKDYTCACSAPVTADKGGKAALRKPLVFGAANPDPTAAENTITVDISKPGMHNIMVLSWDGDEMDSCQKSQTEAHPHNRKMCSFSCQIIPVFTPPPPKAKKGSAGSRRLGPGSQ